MKSILSTISLSGIRGKVFGGIFGWRSHSASTMGSLNCDKIPSKASAHALGGYDTLSSSSSSEEFEVIGQSSIDGSDCMSNFSTFSQSSFETLHTEESSLRDRNAGIANLENPQYTWHCGSELQSRLMGELVKIPGRRDRKGFFPETTFTEVINEQSVHHELNRYPLLFDPNTVDIITAAVCGDVPFRKVFTLLVVMNKLSDIRVFIDDRVSDETLPLSSLPESNSTDTFQLGSNRALKKSIRQLGCFAKWDAIDIWTFEEWQWTTLSPVLERGGRRNVKHLIIQDELSLPFTNDSRYSSEAHTLVQGGFSTVSKVHIHPANHRFHGPENVHNDHFAVKCLSSDMNRQDFKQEVDMLMTYSGDTHPHLISLLATYEQYRTFYLIFPWAEADLQSYLERKNPRPKMDHPTVQWLADQCHGIASGLCQLHRHQTSYISSTWSDNEMNSSEMHENGRTNQVELYGRHGDIKLQNVLWFCDPKKSGDKGVLKITDFGLAEFKTSPARLYRGGSRVKFSPPYQPPECTISGGRVGQSHDIWSLGCLYLELITWLLGGWELVKSFQIARKSTHPEYYAKAINGTFFTIMPGGVDGSGIAAVKPAVTKFIESLHNHAACTEYLHKFLDLIERDMLIIKSTNPTEKGRIRIPELTFHLGALFRQVCDDAAFATTAVAWNLREA